MTTTTDPTAILRLFRVPDPNVGRTIEFLLTLPELAEVSYELRNSSDGELEVAVHGASPVARDEIVHVFHRRHGFQLFSTGGATVDDIVAERMADHRVITAESCTGGLVLARLTDRPGSSGYVVGGVGAYSVDVARTLLQVPTRVISERGVVSAHTAEHMAKGALALSESLKLEADTAIAVTGVAGPGGGSDEIPVGTVCLCAMSRSGGMIVCRVELPGDRGEVRRRATALGMHILRVLRGTERLDVRYQVDT